MQKIMYKFLFFTFFPQFLFMVRAAAAEFWLVFWWWFCFKHWPESARAG